MKLELLWRCFEGESSRAAAMAEGMGAGLTDRLDPNLAFTNIRRYACAPPMRLATLTLLTPTNLTAQVSGGNLTLNWPLGHTGWRLQAQTNSPHIGLGTNWWNVPGSDATNRWVIPIGATNPTVFFRLAYP